MAGWVVICDSLCDHARARVRVQDAHEIHSQTNFIQVFHVMWTKDPHNLPSVLTHPIRYFAFLS